MLRRALVAASYIVGGLVIIGATVGLVAYGKGYSYDFKNHRFILNGLVILESSPSGGKVLINGLDAHHSTPYRSTIESGDYTFSVVKDGFRTWTKTLTLIPSEVTFAQYVVLFPTTITTEPTKLAVAAYGLADSPNRKRLAYLSSGKKPAVYLMDAISRMSKRYYAARAGETLTSVSWSDDGSRLLLATTYKKRAHFLVLDAVGTAPAEDLTDLFNQDFRQLKFNPANRDELYWISPESNLHRLNLAERTASAVLASNVSSLGFGGGRVFFVQTTPLGQSLFSLDRSGHKTELIQALAKSDSYEILEENHKDKDYLVVVPARARTATIYQDFFSGHPVATVIGKGVDKIVASPNGRFLAAYGAGSVVAYDLEKTRHYDFKLSKHSIDNLGWYDDFHLLATVNGQPEIVEFDGGNLTLLPGGLQGTVFSSPDRANLIGLSKDKAATSVVYELLK